MWTNLQGQQWDWLVGEGISFIEFAKVVVMAQCRHGERFMVHGKVKLFVAI